MCLLALVDIGRVVLHALGLDNDGGLVTVAIL